MSDEDLVLELRSAAEQLSSPALLSLLADRVGPGLTQFRAIQLLKAAFPEVPLSVFKQVSASIRIAGAKGIGDDAVIELLGSKLGGPAT